MCDVLGFIDEIVRYDELMIGRYVVTFGSESLDRGKIRIPLIILYLGSLNLFSD